MTSKQVLSAATGLAIFGLIVLITKNMKSLDSNAEGQRELYKSVQSEDDVTGVPVSPQVEVKEVIEAPVATTTVINSLEMQPDAATEVKTMIQ